MNSISLRASRRDVLGKKVKHLRRQGLIPANLFGHGVRSVPLQVDLRDIVQVLRTAGTHALVTLHLDDQPPTKVLVRGFHTNPVNGELLHVDLYQVAMREKLRARVPLKLVGEAPAVAQFGGILVRGADEVEIECLPTDLPSAIIVDLGQLTELDSSIHVRDLVPPPGISFLTEPDEVIARIAAPRVEKMEEEAVPEMVPETPPEAAKSDTTSAEETST